MQKIADWLTAVLVLIVVLGIPLLIVAAAWIAIGVAALWIYGRIA